MYPEIFIKNLFNDLTIEKKCENTFGKYKKIFG